MSGLKCIGRFKYLRYFYRNGPAPDPVSLQPYQFCCRNASSFCHRTADSGISEKDPRCDPSDFPEIYFRRCLYAPFPVLWKIYGDFLFHSTTAGTYIRTMSFICPFLYLNTTLTSVLNGLGRSDLSDTQCSQPMYPGSFCTLAIPIFGIRGYLYGILFSELILTVLHIIALSALGNLSEKH